MHAPHSLQDCAALGWAANMQRVCLTVARLACQLQDTSFGAERAGLAQLPYENEPWVPRRRGVPGVPGCCSDISCSDITRVGGPGG